MAASRGELPAELALKAGLRSAAGRQGMPGSGSVAPLSRPPPPSPRLFRSLAVPVRALKFQIERSNVVMWYIRICACGVFPPRFRSAFPNPSEAAKTFGPPAGNNMQL